MTQNSGAYFFQEVCKISRQLARPLVAGFQSFLDQETSFFVSHCGARRDSLIGQIHPDDFVDLKNLYWGEPGLLFGIIGEAGVGKTALALHLQWCINCLQPRILQDILDNDITWAYFQSEDKFDSFKIPLPPIESDATSRDGTTYLGLRLSNRTLNRHPVHLLAIYVYAQELVTTFSHLFNFSNSANSNGYFDSGFTAANKAHLDFDLLLDAAYNTYLHLVKSQNYSRERFIEVYRCSRSVGGFVSVYLFVDGIEFVDFKSRAALLTLLSQSTNEPECTYYRIFFISRPLALFGVCDLPDSVIWLLLNKLSHFEHKCKMIDHIAPELASLLEDEAHSFEAKIHKNLIEFCETPFLLFLLARLQSRRLQINPSLYDFLDTMIYTIMDNMPSTRDGRDQFPLFIDSTNHPSNDDSFNMDIFAPIDSNTNHPLNVAPSNSFSVGFLNVDWQHFKELVDLVTFFYHCWIPSPVKHDWTIRKRFEHLIFILLKHAHEPLENTILGKLRIAFINFNKSISTPSFGNSTHNDSAFTQVASHIWQSTTRWLKNIGLVHFQRAHSTRDQSIYEIIFRDGQLEQYFTTSFLINEKLESAIFLSISKARENMVDFDRDFPNIFLWSNAHYMTNKHWSFVYDLTASKMGIIWISQRILPKDLNIYKWLQNIRHNQGVDKYDWGQIRFNRLLRGFAIKHDDYTFSQNKTPPIYDDSMIQLKDAFESTFISIVEHNPSGIFHVEKYPVFRLDCFSNNAVEIILTKMIDIMCKGNSPFIFDIFKELDHHSRISPNVINYIVTLLNSSKSSKFVHQLLTISVLPITKKLILVAKCLASDVLDIQNTAIEILINFGRNSLALSKKIYSSKFFSDSSLSNEFLFEDETWDLLIRKSIGRIQEMTIKTCHLLPFNPLQSPSPSSPNNSYASLLTNFLKMLESNDPNSRLLVFLLNCYDELFPEIPEFDKIEYSNSEFELFDRLCGLYWNYFGEGRIEEVGGDDHRYGEAGCCQSFFDDYWTMRLFLLSELLGCECVSHIQRVHMFLLMNNSMLVRGLSRWCLLRLMHCNYSHVFSTLFSFKGLHQSFIDLLLTHRSFMANFNYEMLTKFLFIFDKTSSSLLSLEEQRLRLSAIEVLNESAKWSNSSDYRLHAVDKIVWLLGLLGFGDSICTEPLLDTLYFLLSEPGFSSEKDEIVALLSRNNMHQKLLQTLRKPTCGLLFLGQIRVASLLEFFIASDSEDMLEYVSLLPSCPEIRSLSIERLGTIDYSLLNSLLSHLSELPFSSNYSLHVAYTAILITLGRRGGRFASKIRQVALEHLSLDSNEMIRQGFMILSDMDLDSDCRSCLESWFFEKIGSLAELTHGDISLLNMFISLLPSFNILNAAILENLLVLLRDMPHSGFNNSICKFFKKVSGKFDNIERSKCEDHVRNLLQHRESTIRKISIKILSYLGRDVISRSAAILVKLSAADQEEPYVRKQALDAISHLLRTGDDQLRKETLLLLPAVSSSLGDKSSLVLTQALNIIASLKIKSKRVNLEKMSPFVDTQNEPILQIDSNGNPFVVLGSHGQGLEPLISTENEDNESWYIRKVIKPNLEQIGSILTKKRFRHNMRIKIAILNCLGQTKYLYQYLDSFKDVISSENGSNLVEFDEVIKHMCPASLLYVPYFIMMKPAPVLVRNLLKLLTRYEKQLTPKACKKHFPLQILIELLNNKDALVRKITITLLGKYVYENPKFLWVLILKWNDISNKVRKEVMEVLGDIGKKNPEYISQILSLIDPKSITSIMIWSFLSKSWGVLISSSLIKQPGQFPPRSLTDSKK